MKLFGLLAAAVVWALPVSAQNETEQKPTVHKVIMQLVDNDAKELNGLFKQLNNLTNGYGDRMAIEVVCHGPGIDVLHKERSEHYEDLIEMTKRGVVFYGCENTLRGRNIPRDALFEEFDLVPMGIGEIVEKQEQGWSYIKAGL